MGMIIDGISTSQHLDSSGEILDIAKHDISDLVEGRGCLNWEHNNDSPEDIIGKIIFAKKIIKKDDCENEREKMYWDTCKVPFCYIKAELFDSELHPGAIAAAALIRYYNKRGEKILAGFSIEGATLEREDNVLKRTVGRRVALTLKPCNKTAISGVLEDPVFSEVVKKYINLDKSSLTPLFKVESCILEDNFKTIDPVQDLKDTLSILQKTLTAGNYNVAPSQLSGGSALQTEHNILNDRNLKNRLKAAVRDWNRMRPLKEAIKAALPEVSDNYVDYFTDLAEQMTLKKGLPKLKRIGIEHSYNKNADDEQNQLISGLYIDQAKPFNDPSELNYRAEIKRLKNDVGDDVLIKTPSQNPESDVRNHARNATNYFSMAKNFFGLGEHVPVTNHVTHDALDDRGYDAQVIKYHPNAVNAFHPKFEEVVQQNRENGSLHKLALMDMITGGDYDRHFGNMLADGDKILHIDNDDAFDYEPASSVPHYFGQYNLDTFDIDYNKGMGSDTIHADANNWLQSLDVKKMLDHMKKLGMSKAQMFTAAKRLKLLQHHAPMGKKFSELHDMINSGE